MSDNPIIELIYSVISHKIVDNSRFTFAIPIIILLKTCSFNNFKKSLSSLSFFKP